MRILAIETSTRQGSIALLQEMNLIDEVFLPAQLRTARALAPVMADALRQAHWTPRAVELVGVASGPGSFTGLRIATTAAKTFAYAAGARLVALNTLDVLVEQLPDQVLDACAVMDAQRQQLFAARYSRVAGGPWRTIEACQIVARDALSHLLTADTVLTGPGLARLPSTLYQGHARSDSDCWMPHASTVGRLAWRAHQAGRTDDPFRLEPQYFRPSYAEEPPRDESG